MGMRQALVLFVMVFFAGCATVPRPGVSGDAPKTLQGFCAQYNIDCRWDGVAQTVDMSYAGKKIKALVGSNIVLIDGERKTLGDVLRRQRGAIMVPADFEAIVVGPAAKPQEDYQKAGRAGGITRVMIDAGHGGKDPGAIGYRGLKEKDVNLDVALKVARAFEAQGITAVLSRQGDDFLTLQERTELASQAGIDLFVSIHANANKSRSASGVEVYYAEGLKIEDRFSDQRRANEKKLSLQLNMIRDSSDVRKIVADMLYSYKRMFSAGLAEAVARGLSFEVSGRARGSKPQRFYVLRNTLIPAVLVEVGFVTNPAEARLLQDPGYRQKIAEAIVKSVLRYGNAAGM